MQLPDATPRSLGELSRFLAAAYHRMLGDHCLRAAGSLTFTTPLALVPLVTVALALVTAFPVFGEFTGGIDQWLVVFLAIDRAFNRIFRVGHEALEAMIAGHQEEVGRRMQVRLSEFNAEVERK